MCREKKEAQRAMRIVHEGICGTHVNDKMLVQKIMRKGYYWTTMNRDCHQHVTRCSKCQIYANLQHVPLHLYITMMHSQHEV